MISRIILLSVQSAASQLIEASLHFLPAGISVEQTLLAGLGGLVLIFYLFSEQSNKLTLLMVLLEMHFKIINKITGSFRWLLRT